VTSQNFYVEPPTLISLGFEWQIDGDDNRNASVGFSWRKKGDEEWHEGLPLLRIGNERLNENAIQYVTPNMLAGSIFDLEPGTEYECRFVLSDPDDPRILYKAADFDFQLRLVPWLSMPGRDCLM
jgi:hypothetical protein